MSNKILFFGNERLATGLTTTAPTLRALIAAGYEITGVITAQSDTKPSRKARPLEIVQVAEAYKIPVYSPAKLSDFIDDIKVLGAEIGILVAYGQLVPANIMKLFPRGIVNIHPSLLPRHRGSIPIEGAILNGESETGASLMQLVPKMDAGPIYAQQSMPLDGTETKQQLADTLQLLGTELLVQHLPAILDGSLEPMPQNENQATYDKRIQKADGKLDFNKAAKQLAREVRAYAGWPRSTATLATMEVISTAAHVIDGNGLPGTLWLNHKQLGVHTNDGILIIDKLIPAGKKEMSAAAFLSGYQV
jgi:methionyl-tRNA formyltransferase